MKVKEALILSSSNIRIHKLRSILTTVGVILGIAAVIAVVTLGASFQAYYINQLKGALNPTFFGVLPGKVETGAAQGGFFVAETPIFTDRDVEEISRVDYIKNVYPLAGVATSADGVRFNDRVLLAPVGSVTVLTISGGAFGPEGAVTVEHGETFSNVSETVVGYGVAEIILKQENLTEISDVLGKAVTVEFFDGNTTDFSIVGIIKSTLGLGGGGIFDYNLFVDMSYYSQVRQVPGEEREETVYYMLSIVAKEVGEVKKAQDAVLDYLRTNSDAKKFLDRDAPELDFIVLSEEEIVKLIQTQIGQFESFITSVGFISLLVGTVGIANMMLVSVRERTREIGILKAFGASKRDILQVFLFEASLMGAIGSLIGVIVGIGLGYLFTTHSFFAATRMPLTYKPEWIPISVTMGLLVGIISGLYPAWRASKVNPVEALRYE